MPMHDVVTIGGSAGAIGALSHIVELLPPYLKACVFVAIHTRAHSDPGLPGILGRRSSLPVSFANDFDPILHGHIYVARPDCHLLLEATHVRVLHGPRENGFRPAIDPLFRTAAREFGPRVVGVVLSGALSDGTYGLSVIKQYGGIAVVQDPADAVIDSMPKSAIAAVDVDHVIPAPGIASLIAQLAHEPAGQGDTDMARARELEPQLPSEETAVGEMEQRFGAPSSLTCPDCGGALWEVEEGRVVRYQCHVGHQYAPDVLESEQRNAVDDAMWSAVRVLEEYAELKSRMAGRAKANGLIAVAEGFEEGARESHAQAQQIRRVLFSAGNGGAIETTRREAAAGRPRPARKMRRTKQRRVK